MAKAKRIKTKTPGIYKVGDRYEWRACGDSGTTDTLDEARAAKRKAETRGPITRAGRGSFGDYAREWIDTFAGRTRRGFSEGTRQRYRESLELYAIPFFDTKRKRKLADITRRDAKAFLAYLTNHEARGGQPLKAGAIDRTIAPVSIMLNDAIDDGIIPPGNPFNGLRANVRADDIDLEADDNDRRALTHDELAHVLAAATETEHLLITALVDSGVRWGEFCELRGRDLKTGQAGPYIAVRRAYDAKIKKVGRPKSGKTRDIPISPDLARRLWRLQRGPDELIFQSPQEDRLNYQNTLRRILKPLLERASVDEDLTWAAFHTFRHTFASLLFDAGINVKRVSKLLGHHKASFTLDYYTHLIDDGDGQAISVVALLEARGGQSGASGHPETAVNDEAAAARKPA